MLPKERAVKFSHPGKRRRHLICGCKGTPFPETDKTLRYFFQKKMHFIRLYIIYYIRARQKQNKNGSHLNWNDCHRIC